MNKEFFFYNCQLEGRQLCLDETEMLPAKIVLRSICDADYQENGIFLKDLTAESGFLLRYAKPPKDGLFLMNATKTGGYSSLYVLIDTRLSPNFILIEKKVGLMQEYKELLKVLESSICEAVYKHGWLSKLVKNDLNVIKEVEFFFSAMKYIEGETDFRSCILYEERTDEILNMLHLKIDHKVKAQAIMCVIKAAIDAGLISKPEYESFVREFKKGEIVSFSTFKAYTKSYNNPLVNDKSYNEYLEQFMRLKDKWLNEISAA